MSAKPERPPVADDARMDRALASLMARGGMARHYGQRVAALRHEVHVTRPGDAPGIDRANVARLRNLLGEVRPMVLAAKAAAEERLRQATEAERQLTELCDALDRRLGEKPARVTKGGT